MTYSTDTADDLRAALNALDVHHVDRRGGPPAGKEWYVIDFAGYYDAADLSPAEGYVKHVARITVWCRPITGRVETISDAVIAALQAASRHRIIVLSDIPFPEDYAAEGADGADGSLVPLRFEVTEA